MFHLNKTRHCGNMVELSGLLRAALPDGKEKRNKLCEIRIEALIPKVSVNEADRAMMSSRYENIMRSR
jgi:hypothetical protein